LRKGTETFIHGATFFKKKVNVESTPKSTILVKIEAGRILEPQLTLVNEDFKILENDEFGQKRLFGEHSMFLN